MSDYEREPRLMEEYGRPTGPGFWPDNSEELRRLDATGRLINSHEEGRKFNRRAEIVLPVP